MIWLVRLYQKIISPLKPPCCRFTPTCSAYAIEAFRKRGFFVGLILTAWRILRCNPFCKGGYDPVPKTGFRNPKIGRNRENVYDSGYMAEKNFVFFYDLPYEDRKEKSKNTKNKRED